MGWGRWWEGPECCAYAGAGIDGARGHGVVGGVVKPVQGVGVRVAGSRGVPHSEADCRCCDQWGACSPAGKRAER